MCGLGVARCRKALEENGADVERALASLIDAGEVKSDDLDPDTVPEALFGRATQRQKQAIFQELTEPSGAFFKRLPKELREAFEDEIASAAAAAEDSGTSAASGSTARVMAKAKRRAAALDKKPVVVHLPPLPKLTLTLNEWVGGDVLKTWAGFGEGRGSKGKVTVNIPRAPYDEDDANPVPPAPEMVAAYAHLKAHEPEVTAAVLDAFRSYLNELITKWKWDLKPVADVRALKKMMEVGSVHPLTVAKDGMAYLGLFFQCTWDEEHAAGATLHGSRVVKVGDHEAAYDVYAALDDGGKEIRGWQRGLAKVLAKSRAAGKPPWVP
jgi:hypothetical protein